MRIASGLTAMITIVLLPCVARAQQPRVQCGPSAAVITTPAQQQALVTLLQRQPLQRYTIMQRGGRPFVVTGTYGKQQARVACILGAPLGEPTDGQRAFWQSPAWHYLVRNLVWWCAREDRRF